MQSLGSTPFVAHPADFEGYIIPLKNQVVSTHQGSRGSIIYRYEDASEWVLLRDSLKERFCGFLYLQTALKGSSKIVAAENRMAIQNRRIVYLSRYCGENKVGLFNPLYNELPTLSSIGFTDTSASANLREKDGKIHVFDTEKSSFDKGVHEKIDAYVNLHDAIRSTLERMYSENE